MAEENLSSMLQVSSKVAQGSLEQAETSPTCHMGSVQAKPKQQGCPSHDTGVTLINWSRWEQCKQTEIRPWDGGVLFCFALFFILFCFIFMKYLACRALCCVLVS